jgi:hypothetical protein
MRIYKFQDTVDGNFAFIIAKSKSEAIEKLQTLSSLDCKFIEDRSLDEYGKPIVLLNQILPF